MQDKDESIISHIEALRTMLLKCFKAFGLILIPMLFIAPKALELFLKIILRGNDIAVNYFSPVEVFVIQIKTAFILSLIAGFPYFAKQIWSFLLPALYDNERNFIQSIVFISATLFISGAIFCLFVILPLIINFGKSFATADITPVLGISNVVNLSVWLILAFGAMFQLPLITYSLIKSDIVSYRSVSDKRPYVIVGILILAAILTPPDVVSQIMLFIPTYCLFELGLLFAMKYKNRK